MINRRILHCLLFGMFLTLCSLHAASDFGIKYVKLKYYEDEQFRRISEFFTGQENTGKRLILRSDPSERNGVYFVLKLTESLDQTPPDLVFVLDYFHVGLSSILTQRFDLQGQRSHHRIVYLGITNEQFEKDDTLPLAWRVRILNKENDLIAEKKSYLWEMPE